MNSKRIVWIFAVLLGSLLVFSQTGMAYMGSGTSAADPNYRIKFMGAEVVNPQGDHLGRVVDVTLSDLYAHQNVSSFIIVDPNVSELNGQYVAIPFRAPQDYVSPGGMLTLAITRDELAHAPNFSKDQWPMSMSNWATDSYSYFGRTPYFSD
jgi:hypothetical protein